MRLVVCALLLLLLAAVSTRASSLADRFDESDEAEFLELDLGLDATPATATATPASTAKTPPPCVTSADCSSNGVCKAGNCLCAPTFTGARCEKRVCPGQCSGNGVCDPTTGRCQCYNATQLALIYPIDGPEHEWGFTGADCSIKLCATDCGVREGRGACNTTTGLCECKKGYWGLEGQHCNSVLCDDPCSSHGFCVDQKCICDVAPNMLSGWTGAKCETPICPNHCSAAAGLGACVNGACVCAAEWYGDDCSLKKCPMNYSPLAWSGATKVMCSGHGDCVDGKCECFEGFSGDDCSIRICPGVVHNNSTAATTNSTTAPVSCSGHGVCQPNGMCVCNAGFEGEDCADRTCPSDCGEPKKRGGCNTETGECECNFGWYGPACTYKRCDDSCNDHGTCLDDACVCDIGYQGVHCEFAICGNNCTYSEGHGQCIDNKCVCNPGFNGAECLYNDCPVAHNPLADPNDVKAPLLTCGGNGVCTRGECVCNAAWRGVDCTVRRCPLDCSGVGECSPEGTCTCPVGDEEGRGGFLGKFCEQELCPGNCTESLFQGACISGKCHCEEGFGQPDCRYPACPFGMPPMASPFTSPASCSGTGECVQGKCKCHDGWTGDNCAAKMCKSDCGASHGHGVCLPTGQCKCTDRFTGADCSVEACPDGCSGHGICVGKGQCQCDAGWTGDQCEIKRCPNNCSSAGQCIRVPATETQPAYERCECDLDYQGVDCSQPMCPPIAVDGSMCEGGKGRCVVSHDGIHVCRCNPPFVGAECGNRVCNNTCSYHGVCVGEVATDAHCECDDGWFGPNCDRRGECEPSHDCNGNGKCVAGLKGAPTCQCHAPFGGLDCGQCTHNCTGHGDCTADGCKCRPGWFGPLCDRRQDCDPADCGGEGHGVCVADANGQPSCVCQHPWTDFDCKQCTLTCSEHGECNEQGRCECDKGWEGENCDRFGDCPNHCSDRGICVGDAIGDPVCQCLKGYAGRDCGHIICDKECPAHSTCLDDECVCEEGWKGDQCLERDDCLKDCSGHGMCMGDLDGIPFCKCEIGRTGEACEYVACKQACSDHGTCTVIKGQEVCKCDPGFGGSDCAELDCGIWHDCNGPTHGVCAFDAKGKPGCQCVPPFTGTNCTDIICSKTHCIHGTCANERCTCEPGWKGAKCDYRVPCPAPGCGEEGQCVGDGTGKGVCECNAGFTGPNCLDIVCEDKCSGHGRCLNLGCVCDNGFHGEHCEIAAPCPNNCSGHGECNFDKGTNSSVCDCEDLYDGDDCSIQRGKTWIDSSKSMQYACFPPYYGDLCQHKGCVPACQNGGVCGDDGICDCASGYEGDDCSEPVCPGGCSHGGGECDLVNRQCRCFYGYSGEDCSIYNEEVCQMTCAFQCSIAGAGGMVRVGTRDPNKTQLVTSEECHARCKLPTMCAVMFGSGYADDPNGLYVTLK